MTKATSQYRKYVSMALIVVLLVIIVLGIVFPPSRWIPAADWGAWLESKGLPGIVIFVALSALATSIGLPRQMVAFIAGVAYGVGPALLLSLVAALTGCYLTVVFSRRFLASWVKSRYPKVINQLQALLKDDVFLKILILRLQPLGTNLLTNTCVGFTTIPLRLFIAASAVGYIPQMLVFVLLGSGVRVGSQAQLALSGVLLVISVLLGIYLYRKYRRVRIAQS